MRYEFTPKKYYYTFGPNTPALRIRAGDTLTTTTVDAHGFDSSAKPIPEEMKQSSEDTEYYPANPLVGPFYIEDATIKDSLAIRIEEISLNRETAWSTIRAHFGSLTEESPGRRLLLNEPLPEHYFEWRLDLKRNAGILNLQKSRLKRIEIPLDPFIGSIGVAPRHGRQTTALTPGEYGGNMDCVETREGTTIYFPVFVKGAYLAFGDIHAAQGDGELCGSALETTAKVTLRIDVIKKKSIEWPRFEDDRYIMVAGSSRPLMEAYKIAHLEMMNWLVSDFGFDKYEAIEALSQVGTCRVGNIVDPNYTIVSKFPRKYLP